MIIFNEGLPRSGKSHDAVKSHIFPAVKAGRAVVAYIEGLDPEAVCVSVGVDPDVGCSLFTILTREQVPDIWKYAVKDSLIVIDEVQNFWPTGRQPLNAEMTRFIAEHGHDGQDIIIMGQALIDVHPAWRRRVSQKVVFTKMEAVGAATRYTWVSYKASAPEKFQVSQKGPVLGEKYDPRVFECYKSHNEGTENKETYVDPRANLLKSPAFRYGLPIILAAMVFGGWFLYRSFWGGGLVEATTKKNAPSSATASSALPAAPVHQVNQAMPGQQQRGAGQAPKDWSDRLFERLENARVIYFNSDVTRGRYWRRPGVAEISELNDVWLEVRGSGVNHIISLSALRMAGISVQYDKSGHDRYVVVTYKDKTALIGEGLRVESSGMALPGGRQ